MTKPGETQAESKSEVLLELQRLDAGSAVALVGHPLHGGAA